MTKTKKAAGTKKAGTKKAGTKKAGSKKTGSKKAGAKKAGSKKTGSKKTGSKKTGTKKVRSTTRVRAGTKAKSAAGPEHSADKNEAERIADVDRQAPAEPPRSGVETPGPCEPAPAPVAVAEPESAMSGTGCRVARRVEPWEDADRDWLEREEPGELMPGGEPPGAAPAHDTSLTVIEVTQAPVIDASLGQILASLLHAGPQHRGRRRVALWLLAAFALGAAAGLAVASGVR